MKVRHKDRPDKEGIANNFNLSTVSSQEMFVYFPGDADSDYVKDYEVFLESTQEWKDMNEAFRDHDLITDNYNHHFFEPDNDMDRERGYTI